MGVELTAGATHEGHGDEYGHEHERTGDNGHGHVAHGILGGQIGTLVAGIKLGLDSLHHHNGIVHHRTDGQHQGKEGEQVEREARNHKAGKRTHQRHDDGNGRNEGGLEVLKEEVYDQYHQDDGYDKGLLHIGDGCQQEVVGAHHLLELQALGQVLAQFLQLGGDAVVGLLGVRTCQLETEE